MEVSASGRLEADPDSYTTPNGVEVTVARVAVPLKVIGGGRDKEAVRVYTVASAATTGKDLALHRQGDEIAFFGQLQGIVDGTGAEGRPKVGQRIYLRQIISARTAQRRPR